MSTTGRSGIRRAKTLREVPAVHAGHHDVRDEDVEVVRVRLVELARAAAGVAAATTRCPSDSSCTTNSSRTARSSSTSRMRSRSSVPCPAGPRGTRAAGRSSAAGNRSVRRRPDTERRVDGDRAAAGVDDAVRRRETETGSVLALRGEERLEDPGLRLLVDPAARVGDRELHEPVVRAARDRGRDSRSRQCRTSRRGRSGRG